MGDVAGKLYVAEDAKKPQEAFDAAAEVGGYQQQGYIIRPNHAWWRADGFLVYYTLS